MQANHEFLESHSQYYHWYRLWRSYIELTGGLARVTFQHLSHAGKMGFIQESLINPSISLILLYVLNLK